uniref:Gem-associated protein 7 n=1 Tax=Caenorhabditis tropicalis TaxID=1561998 RepID=A0A1I7SZ76_9PELO
MHSELSEGEEQRRRAVLRERYLKFLQIASDKQATIDMCEKTKVTATIKSFQLSSDHVIVENLATPIGVLQKAVLRSSDIVKIRLNSEKPTENS